MAQFIVRAPMMNVSQFLFQLRLLLLPLLYINIWIWSGFRVVSQTGINQFSVECRSRRCGSQGNWLFLHFIIDDWCLFWHLFMASHSVRHALVLFPFIFIFYSCSSLCHSLTFKSNNSYLNPMDIARSSATHQLNNRENSICFPHFSLHFLTLRLSLPFGLIFSLKLIDISNENPF